MKYLVRSILLIFGVGVALIIAEFGLRMLFMNADEEGTDNSIMVLLPDSDRAYAYRPNNDLLHTNSDGFRDTEFDAARRGDETAIVMLGDSITAGNGIDWDETVSSQLSRVLNRQFREPGYRVYNLGVSGYNVSQVFATLKEVGLALEPDVVIYNLCFNDSDTVAKVGQTGLMTKSKISRLSDINFRTIINSSYLLSLIKHQVVTSLQRHAPGLYEMLLNPNLFLNTRVSETGWSEMKDMILEMRRVSEENGARFIVVMYPYASQVGLPEKELSPQNDLAAFFTKHDIEYLDPMQVYENADEDMFSDRTIHLSVYGAGQIADTLAGFLADKTVAGQSLARDQEHTAD